MSKRTARIALRAHSLEQLPLAEPVEQAEGGQDEDRGDDEDDEHGVEGRVGRRRWAIFSEVGSR